MKRTIDSRGVTLAEVLIAIAILGTTFSLMKLGVDWMVALGRQRVLLTAQWNGQVTLYEITRNVRNCKQIVTISSDTLVLAVFRPAQTDGWDNPNFVVTRATGTVIYHYVANGSETYLQRTDIYPDPTFAGPEQNAPTISQNSKLLVNMLEPPVGNMWMFSPYGVNTPGAYAAVEIRIRIRPTYLSSANHYDSPIEYRTISMMRTASIS